MTVGPQHILLVTDHLASTPAMLLAIRERAARGPITLEIRVPNPAPAEWHPMHPERHDRLVEGERVLQSAQTVIEQATGQSAAGLVSIRHDPMDVIEAALCGDTPIDEIFLAMTPHGVQQHLHIDLPRRVAHIGLPVTTITDSLVAEVNA